VGKDVLNLDTPKSQNRRSKSLDNWGILMRGRNVSTQEFVVDGILVNLMSMSKAVTAIINAALAARSFIVCTLNVDHLAKLQTMPKFRESYQKAEFVTADGFPIVMLGRLAGSQVFRTTGADLVEPVCREAASHGLTVFFFGSTMETLAECARRLESRYPALKVAGMLAPGRNFDPYSREADDAISIIRNAQAGICFLALGAPRQELFAVRCSELIQKTGFLCVGAALNFIAGTERRAPRVIQRIDLEWLWRLLHDPRRLTGRYARGLGTFIRLAVREVPSAVVARRWRKKIV
jgi:N-acetylglucosaminyldiphosphoundecaprenol N-acetyl-beta-D-mannosaminyltransferase